MWRFCDGTSQSSIATFYLRSSCNLLVGGASSEIYRLNLFRDKFLFPLHSACNGINAISENPVHGW